jgi:ubiquinone/menaquinone biosynthesis C-methylase UbiE
VLDIGCAKGFFVKDLADSLPGLQAYGLDISDYALRNAPADIRDRLYRGSCDCLPHADATFAAAFAINTIHNLDKAGCLHALREIERVAPGRGFVQVDAYQSERERSVFEDWMLTAQTYGRPADWLEMFEEAGYTGAYYWTILQVDENIIE